MKNQDNGAYELFVFGVAVVLIFMIIGLLNACTPSVIVVTATPAPSVTPIVDPSPTQEIATLAPTFSPTPACSDPLYSNSECPINEGLFTKPCGYVQSSGRTFEYPLETFPRFSNHDLIPHARCVTQSDSLNIPPRYKYDGHLNIDLAWWRGTITFENTLSSEVIADTCYIVRIPVRTNLPVSIGDTHNQGDIEVYLTLWDRGKQEYVTSYIVPIAIGDMDALFMVRPSDFEAPIYRAHIAVRYAKYVTGAFMNVYAIEWFASDCNGDAIRF